MFRRSRTRRDPRLKAVLDAALEAIIVIDEHGIIDTFNRAAQRMFGYRAAEVTGRSVGILMPEASRRGHEAKMALYLSNGHVRTSGPEKDVVARRKDGSTFPATVAASEFRLRGRRAFAGMIRDMTVRPDLQNEILTISECEQRRVGRELHEGLCQELAGVALLANSMQRKLAAGGTVSPAEAAELAAVTGNALRHARGMARGLDPVATVPLGLAVALAQLAADTADATGIDCVFHHPRPVELGDTLVAVHLYRIAQDAVREAIRSGGARAIIINLLQNPDGLEMSVCDDGSGGIGSAPCVLRMMTHRARAIGATLATAGDPGAAPGARVVCRLPSP